MYTELKNRYDFLLIFDVKDGNPNGDPDAGNLPRIDAETGEGLVTDVCLKRKVRNYVQLTKGCEDGYDIFVKEKAILNMEIQKAAEELGLTPVKKGTKEQLSSEDSNKTRRELCRKFFDIRCFGAVLSSGWNAGQVRGPVQMTFARSVDPIVTLEHTITRMAVATEEEAKKQEGDNRTMGRKHTVPYGLYVSHGFVSPALARQTSFGEEDLTLFWEALKNAFEHDRSAARGLMSTRKLLIFKHDSALGNASSSALFETVRILRKTGVEVPRSFSDYELSMDVLPPGITLIQY